MSKRKHPRRQKKKRKAPSGAAELTPPITPTLVTPTAAPAPAVPVLLSLATARERLRLINLRRSVHHG